MILVVVAPRRAVAEFERVAFAFAESVAKAEAAAAPTLADAARGKAQRVPDSPSSAKPAAVIQTVRGFADTVFVPC